MWPFKTKEELFGLTRDSRGDVTFELTAEERVEVDKEFDAFKTPEGAFRVHPAHADEIGNATVARGLWNYASQQITSPEVQLPGSGRTELIKKALAAIVKAYTLYQLPLFLYDAACFIEMLDGVDHARDAFRRFLHAQSRFKPSPVAEIFLKQRDVEVAVKDARMKAT